MQAPCDPGTFTEEKYLSAAFTSQETFSKLKIIRGMIIVNVFFLDRVFEEVIYYVCRGDFFLML